MENLAKINGDLLLKAVEELVSTEEDKQKVIVILADALLKKDAQKQALWCQLVEQTKDLKYKLEQTEETLNRFRVMSEKLRRNMERARATLDTIVEDETIWLDNVRDLAKKTIKEFEI